ncbi:MAG: hypothetical protein CMH81_02265 [Nitrospiraceae bacterium]|nr:hypothetical protein [Nitrospiraceae bacterium]|tara:strand:+ start:879 stop:1652 length:774 start_codon:yes stop_codon:yes gene_type:complete
MSIFSMPVIVIAVIVMILYSGVKVLREYERGVIFFFGKRSKALIGGNGPGIIVLIPGVYQMVKVSLRTETLDVPSQDIITKDNVTVKVNAVVFFRVVDPDKAILDVENYLYATQQMSQTTLRSVLGQSLLDDLLSKREEINSELQRIIDLQTEPWGVKVMAVEVKNVDLPQEMQRAIARQAEAERERRAKVIHADGEYEASSRLADAAEIMSRTPATLQLRYLQTLTEITVGQNTTVVFPLPMDILSAFVPKKPPET